MFLAFLVGLAKRENVQRHWVTRPSLIRLPSPSFKVLDTARPVLVIKKFNGLGSGSTRSSLQTPRMGQSFVLDEDRDFCAGTALPLVAGRVDGHQA